MYSAAAEGEDLQDMECPNCKMIISGPQVIAHTIQCYKNSTKCKACGTVINKDRKKQHLDMWRNLDVR